MRTHIRLGIKFTSLGFILSVLASAVVIFALQTYAGPIPRILIPVASAFCVFAVMNKTMWQAIRTAHDAGEIERRMCKLNGTHAEERIDDGKSTWFRPDSDRALSRHRNGAHKKTLPAFEPEGLV